MNNNGDLSFGVPWSVYTPAAFPIPDYPVVAAYHADLDTRGTGSVWYRSTEDPTLLAKAASDVQSLSGTFSPQWLFIATWDHVGHFDRGTDKVCKMKTCICLLSSHPSTLLIYKGQCLKVW